MQKASRREVWHMNEDKCLRRYLLFLPINRNTRQCLFDVINYVHSVVGGCTYTRFHEPPAILNECEVSGYILGRYADYPEEDVVCLMVDIDLEADRDLPARLNSLISKIMEMGEEEVWLTYHDVMLTR